MPAPFVHLDTGRVVYWRSNENLHAAGWIAPAPGGGWRLTRAGRAYIRRFLAAYTREEADRDLARCRGRRAARDPKRERMRREREPVFGDRTGGGR